ncbi:MAG: hypothetical protein GC160_07555 [Acidobacteria bacterium]|nr:hypothetical protein [Acidobacteriota bacterium]
MARKDPVGRFGLAAVAALALLGCAPPDLEDQRDSPEDEMEYVGTLAEAFDDSPGLRAEGAGGKRAGVDSLAALRKTDRRVEVSGRVPITEPLSLRGLVLRQQTVAYALDAAADRVVELDLQTGAATDAVALPLRSARFLADAPSGALYVLHPPRDGSTGPAQPGAIVEILPGPLRVAGRIDLPDGVGPSPDGAGPAAFSPDGSVLYLATDSLDGQPGEILGYDLSRRSIVFRVAHPTASARFRELAAGLDGTMLYATDAGVRAFAVDVLTQTVSAQLSLGALTSGGLALHPNGSTLYVGRNQERGVAVVDTATFLLTSEIPLPAFTIKEMAITADGRDLLVNSTTSAALFQIRTGSKAVRQTLDLEAGADRFLALER